jgi:Gpi18-like mannosyltransferase
MLFKNKKSKLAELVDLHNGKAQKYVRLYGFIFIGLLAVLVRISLMKFQNADYQIFSSWYDYVNQHGIHSFKDAFSNYNPPYTYFLYLVTLLPISKIAALKGLMILFDVFMAVTIYMLVKLLHPRNNTPVIAALTSLFLPITLLTGVFWGQFDQLYVGCIILSLYFALKENSRQSWIWFGLGLAVKFQAIFFLPALAITCFKNIKWQQSYWAVISFFVVTLPPMIMGRSLISLLRIYPDQAKLFNGVLRPLNAPNLYQWIPLNSLSYFHYTAIGLALAACVGLLMIAVERKKFSREELVLGTVLILHIVPFLLPDMHDRYFFPAAMASFVLAVVYPKSSYIYSAIAAQIILILSYCPFLFGNQPIPLTVAALAELGVIVYYSQRYLSGASSSS